MYAGHGPLYYVYEEGNIIPLYADASGKLKLVTEAVGDPIYEKNEAGQTVYDDSGKPVPAYYKIPVFEYKKLPVVDTTGKDAILKKMAIIRTYFKDSWGLDLDKIREVVLRKSKEAENMDLTKLP